MIWLSCKRTARINMMASVTIINNNNIDALGKSSINKPTVDQLDMGSLNKSNGEEISADIQSRIAAKKSKKREVKTSTERRHVYGVDDKSVTDGSHKKTSDSFGDKTILKKTKVLSSQLAPALDDIKQLNVVEQSGVILLDKEQLETAKAELNIDAGLRTSSVIVNDDISNSVSMQAPTSIVIGHEYNKRQDMEPEEVSAYLSTIRFDYELSDPARELYSSLVTGEALVHHPDGFKREDTKLHKKSVSTEKEGTPQQKLSAKDEKQKRISQLKQVANRLAAKMTSWGVMLTYITAGEPLSCDLAKTLHLAVSNRLGCDDSLDCILVSAVVNDSKDNKILRQYTVASKELSTFISSRSYSRWEKVAFSGRSPRVLTAEPKKIVDQVKDDFATTIRDGISECKESVSVDVHPLKTTKQVYVMLVDGTTYSQDVENTASTVSFCESISNLFYGGKHIRLVYGQKYLSDYTTFSELTDCDEVNLVVTLPIVGGSQRPCFPESMADAEAALDIKSVVVNLVSPVGRYIRPDILLSELSGTANTGGTNMSLNDALLRRGIGVKPDSITQASYIPDQIAQLWPLERWDTDTEFWEDNEYDQTMYSTSLKYYSNVGSHAETDLSMMLKELTERGGQVRPNAVTDFMFYTLDTVKMGTAVDIGIGDSLAAVYTKLQLYENIACWRSGRQNLPLASQFGHFDSYAYLNQNDANGNINVIYDDAFNPGGTNTRCYYDTGGGNLRRVFPLASGDQYSIAFHTSLSTVPNGATWYSIPQSFLANMDPNYPGITYALFAMALAEYPCGIWNVNCIVRSAGIGGNFPYANNYIPFSNLNSIAGERILHLLIPVKDAEAPATNQARANGQAYQRPYTGPVGDPIAVGYGASTPLNVSFMDNGFPQVNYYNLASFLYTWLAGATPIDVVTLSTFRVRLAKLTNRKRDLRFAQEFAAVLSGRLPCFTEAGKTQDVNITSGWYPPRNEVSRVMQNFFAIRALPIGRDWGLEDYPNQFHYTIPAMSHIFWNKVAMGLWSIDDDAPSHISLVTDGSPLSLNYIPLIVNAYAATASVIFAYYPYSTDTWNRIFSNASITGVSTALRRFFAQGTHTGGSAVTISDVGHVLDSIHRKINGCDPACGAFGYSLYSIMNSPPLGFVPPFSLGGGLLGCTPCVMDDFTFALTSHIAIKEFMLFLPVNKYQKGLPIGDGFVIPIALGTYTSPVPKSEACIAISTVEVPLRDSNAAYNLRLNAIAYNGTYSSMTGLGFPALPVQGAIIASKKTVRDYFIPPAIDPITAEPLVSWCADPAMICSRWIPSIDSNGLRVYYSVTANQDSVGMTQLMAGTSYARIYTMIKSGFKNMPLAILYSNVYQGDLLPSLKMGNDSTPSGQENGGEDIMRV